MKLANSNSLPLVLETIFFKVQLDFFKPFGLALLRYICTYSLTFAHGGSKKHGIIYSCFFSGDVRNMRFNSKELAFIAQQPSREFDKEGVLFMKEKKDGLFKKGEGEYARIY